MDLKHIKEITVTVFDKLPMTHRGQVGEILIGGHGECGKVFHRKQVAVLGIIQ